MNTRGRFGITRDADGKIASIWGWPWYWRYPAGVATIAVAAWVFAMQGGGNNKALWILGAGVLLALTIMYELGCLVVVVAVGWALWALLDPFLPDVELSPGAQLAFVVVFAYYAWYTGDKALTAAESQSRSINRVWAAIAGERDRLEVNVERLHERISALEDRVKKLEQDDLDFRL